ncbi:hypothetical protein CHLRE_02g084200v5 [Chlamydomonas reinhardtii]|uniref:Uncharacterized protein n=1 Tax=Chlamydomonas reinhardtii TaxID=3055 RepID=A0A2K3E0R4_CHLRE|nr:uncharacterized protein CHLRE_02g084200v5 [Chlamydomonas reinhardtii]PNW86382.1 hypothetical protein CHLRE_02g084200v5 [Chlamydomonas reinhardtii]
MSSTTAAPARSKRGKRKLDQAVEQEEKATAGGPAHPGDEAAPPTAPAPRLPHKFRQLDKPANLEAMLKEEKAGCVTAVTFGRDFGIRDGHLEQLALAAGPQLTELRLGSSDTGDGVYLTDAAVDIIVRRCKNLDVLQLASCTGISNKAFAAICSGLPKLRELHVTGHDKSTGALKGKALDPLIQGALPNLRRLYITDQGVGYDAVQRLIKKRGKTLQVQSGETDDDDSFAYGMVMSMQGRGYGDGLYGNMRW